MDVSGSHFGSFGAIFAIKELWQRPLLNGTDGVIVKPSSVARNDDIVGLMDHHLVSREGLLVAKDTAFLS